MPHRPTWIALPFLAAAVLLLLGLWMAKPPATPDTPAPTLEVLDAPTGMGAAIQPRSDKQVSWHRLPARISGRYSEENGIIRHQWPGFHAEARFSGGQLAITFDDETNRYRLTLDDGRAVLLLTRPGNSTLHIDGIGSGLHRARLERLSESATPGSFLGFSVPSRDAVHEPPPAAPKMIEFIGDSDTVGYGNTALGRDCTGRQQFQSTDVTRAFGPRIATMLGADYRLVAMSGIGLVRNYGGAPGRTMTDLYDEALPDEPGAPRAKERAPDLIVIGLGSNDFSTELGPGESDRNPRELQDRFSQALLTFMKARQADAPDARIVLLAFGEYGPDLVAAHRDALAAFVSGGGHADLIVLPELARTGCHWHPSLDDHALIAARLKRLLGAGADGVDIKEY